ncbi:Small heat shock protein chloroplastic [Bienertia sinuspersici]
MKHLKQPFYGSPRAEEVEAVDESKLSSIKEDDSGLYLKMDVPGVAKEDAKVYVENTTLVMKGVRKMESQFGETDKKIYHASIDLMPIHKYKVTEIKAEVKDGVFKVTVPKMKDEERTDVFHIQIN